MGAALADLAALITWSPPSTGIERIRFTTSHPVEFRDSLIEAYRDVPQLASYLHLPVQSGSDRVLALMKRGHTALEYSRSSAGCAQSGPASACRRTSSSAFPARRSGFRGHARLVRDVGFDQSFSFIYSRRPGTPASSTAG